MKFRLTQLLCEFWERLDADEWVHDDTIVLIRCIKARTEKGIPSVHLC